MQVHKFGMGLVLFGLVNSACGTSSPSNNNNNGNSVASDTNASGNVTPAVVLAQPEDFAAQQSVQASNDAAGSTSYGQTSVMVNGSNSAGLSLWQRDSFVTSHLQQLAKHHDLNDASVTAAINANISLAGDLDNQLTCLKDVVGYTQSNGVITIQIDYAAHPCKRGGRSLNGNETLTVNLAQSSASIDSNVISMFPDGDTLYIGTNPNNAAAPTASVTFSSVANPNNPNSPSDLFTISLNEHRVRNNAQNGNIFDHTITTSSASALTITSSQDGLAASIAATAYNLPTLQVFNGTVMVHHNLAKFLATHLYSSLTFEPLSGCSCPLSGSLTQTVTYDADGSGFVRVYTFNGCGSASVVTTNSNRTEQPNGNSTAMWEACQNS